MYELIFSQPVFAGIASALASIVTALLLLAGNMIHLRRKRVADHAQEEIKREELIEVAGENTLNRLEREVIRLAERCDLLERDRDRYFRESVALAAKVEFLNARITTLDTEKELLRGERDTIRDLYQKAHDAANDLRHENGTLKLTVASLTERLAVYTNVQTLQPRPV